MECLFLVLVLAVLAALAVPAAISILALRRTRETEDRIGRLELELSRLRRAAGAARVSTAPGADLTERSEPARPAPAPEAPTPPPPAAPGPPPPPPPASPPRPTPPPRSTPAPTATAPPSAPAPPVDWERWVARGTAVGGGILFALAGIFFVRYAVESGWLAPPVRVALGLLAGLGALAASELLRRRDYGPTADALAGGGVVVLYASTWAARMLYELVPATVAFGLMALITAAAIALAWRRRSLVVALLGLAGGFATPLLLDTAAERPFGLFGYLLVLDLGLLLLARRRRLPALGLLGLLATLFYQAFWVAGAMDPGELPLALGILALFAALFAAATTLPARDGEGDREGPIPQEPAWTRALAILAPFAFALYFAARADLGPHLWPIGALLGLLSAAALVLDRRFIEPQSPPFLGVAAAAASVGVVAVWASRVPWQGPDGLAGPLAWEAAGVSFALAALFHGFGEWQERQRSGQSDGSAADDSAWRSTAFLLPAAGFLLLLAGRPLIAAEAAPLAWAPWAFGPVAVAALLVRQGWFFGVERRPAAAAAVIGLALPLLHARYGDTPGFADPSMHYGLLLALAVALQLVALRASASRRAGAEGPTAPGVPRLDWPEAAALALPFAALVGLVSEAMAAPLGGDPSAGLAASPRGSELFFGLTLALGLLALLAATRVPSGRAILGVTALTAFGHLLWITGRDGGSHLLALAAMAAGVALFTAWPFLPGRRLHDHRAAWYAAALAGPFWFLPMREAWLARFGDGAIGLLPVVLGAVALAAAFRVKALWPADDPRRLSGLVWFGAVALGFAALAVPLQLDEEWITIAWALQGVAVIALWRRLDHPGLKLFGLALLAAVTARLVLNPEVAGYHPRSGIPVFNWLLYTYLVPAASLIGASLLLRDVEVARARGWERIYDRGRPWGAFAAGAAAIAVVFVWITLTVFDLFSAGPELSLEIERTMGRDLTLSLAWALYALILLGLGFARRSRGLRGVGLGLLTLTVVKVFLYDLASLEDLYRVASLAGLALCLVLVSMAYQRFVFRDAESARPPPGTAP